jgi:Asp-tRNA(Asn)/Glu-tRNA(Gln) amidotransferase A subunit family amidase
MGINLSLTRKDFVLSSLGLVGALGFAPESRARMPGQDSALAGIVTEADIEAAERVLGFKLPSEHRKALLVATAELRSGYKSVRNLKLPNSVAPPIPFIPFGKQSAEGSATSVKTSRPESRDLPKTDEDIAFLTVNELSAFIKSRKLTSVRLTKIYLDRIAELGPKLLNVITPTPELALELAGQADSEIANGRYRGALHGIPYGIKDLFSAKGYRTTWGALPFRDQQFEVDAAVVEKLTAAGAILVAKTSVGALAMDDHWFDGKTKNPWNLAQGSSGSSAGSSSGMAAGLFAFSIGTETLGSIMSPSHRCRVTGLRPTFGRISRFGAMALSWTMDKVGPICRTAEDCALVFAALHGKDPRDLATVNRPFQFRSDLDLRKLKIGSLDGDTALDEDDSGHGPDDAIKLLNAMGVEVKPVKFRQAIEGVDMVLTVEAAAAFDEITLDGRVNTIPSSLWPALFRQSEFATGVGYVNAMRARTLVMERFEEDFGDFDVIIVSDRGSHLLISTNLTGHPQIYVPFGLDQKGVARGVSIIGRLHREDQILAVAAQIQARTRFYRNRPDLSTLK